MVIHFVTVLSVSVNSLIKKSHAFLRSFLGLVFRKKLLTDAECLV